MPRWSALDKVLRAFDVIKVRRTDFSARTENILRVCKWAFFFSSLQQTNVQPLAPILASERMSREERGQGICSFPWPEPNVGPPWLPLSLSPLPLLFLAMEKCPEQSRGGREGRGRWQSGWREKERESFRGGRGLLDQEEEREHLC